MARALLLVLDSLGVGSLPDAGRFGDAGADTLGHIAAHRVRQAGAAGALRIPHLQALGLAQAARLASGRLPEGLGAAVDPRAAWAAAAERSSGKDTTSGHWEMAGLPITEEWGYFRAAEHSFPPELLDRLQQQAGLPGWLGDCRASGTEILQRLGEEHLRSGKPIVYTSADSVLQIAAHERGFGLQRLYDLCELARREVDRWRIGRVIARPFVGERAGEFRRSEHRRDYSMPPPGPTLLDHLQAAGVAVLGVGKIADIFAHRGIGREIKAHGIDGLFDASLAAYREAPADALVFTNFVDFDSEYGHRRDVEGYAAALEAFDRRLPELLAQLRREDLLILTADHGNDPTWTGSDHTREYIPILALGAGVRPGSLGLRDSFADIGQSLAGFFHLPPLAAGTTFLETA